MTSVTLRKKIHSYIDNADEEILQIVFMLLDREQNLKTSAITDKDWEEAERRRSRMLNGKEKGIDHLKAISELRSKISKKKKK